MTPVIEKATVVAALREMSSYLQLKGENMFKTRAYDVAADRIAGLAEDLSTVVAQGRLTSLPNIGESIAAKVAELVTTGTMTALQQVKAEFPPKMLELLTVPDLGPKKAKALFDQLGVGDLDSLEKACVDHRVRDLKGFGAKTEEKLLAGLAIARRAKSTGARRKLADVLPQAEAVLAWVKQAPGVVRASLGGSVRRQRETVADVDVIASACDAAPVFKHFEAFPGVAEVLASGESKSSVRLKDTDLQLDLRVLPDGDFATALHHFTGSKAHHIKLRGLALEKGFTLSEWGLFRIGTGNQAERGKGARHDSAEEKLHVPTEEALYGTLGLQYVPPELREDWGEIEAAAARTLPTDLIEQRHIQGNVHAHTTWSDGKNSLEEMARGALAMGMRYLTVTEHSPTSNYAGGLSLDRLKKQWDEIDEVQAKVPGITLLKGIESDILEDGRLDFPDEVLAQLDVVIGSIHQRYSQDEAAMTKRVLAAFDNPFFHIWGHPTGRLLNRREPAAMQLERILDKAAEKGVIIEVNGCPDRLDLAAEHVKGALARGLKLSVSTDAHSVEELHEHLPLAIATARRGWARVGNVVNTHDVKGFRAALRTR
jgi:DNA polymerase (family X)